MTSENEKYVITFYLTGGQKITKTISISKSNIYSKFEIYLKTLSPGSTEFVSYVIDDEETIHVISNNHIINVTTKKYTENFSF